MARPSKLPVHPRQMVLTALRKSKAPLTAYGVLERLEPLGVKSPPIVYRALEALEKTGQVHRIQALNAYVACNCHADHAHELSVLTVCRNCREVKELHDHAVIDHLMALRELKVNLAEASVIELPILCGGCGGG